MKKLLLVSAGVAAIGVILWATSAPPSYHEPAGPSPIGPVPKALLNADIGDVIKSDLVTIAPKLPGHDEILPLPGTSKVLVSARDEWVMRTWIPSPVVLRSLRIRRYHHPGHTWYRATTGRYILDWPGSTTTSTNTTPACTGSTWIRRNYRNRYPGPYHWKAA